MGKNRGRGKSLSDDKSRKCKRSIIQPNAYFQFDLEVGNLAILQMAAGFGDLEPVHVTQCFGGAFNGIVNGISIDVKFVDIACSLVD